MYFNHFVIISPLKRARPFIWTNLNSLPPRMPCAKFGWNWLSGSGGEDFFISSMYFCYFIIISPGKGEGPSFEQTWIPFTQGCFVWNWPSSGEEDFLISSMYLYYPFPNYLPLKKGGALHFNKLESRSPKDAFWQVWLKLAQWFWRRRWKCKKFTDRQTEGQTYEWTDERTDRRRTTEDQKSSLELSAQVS